MGVVTAAAVYSKKGPRDAVPTVKEVEGTLGMNLLSSYAKEDHAKALEVMALRGWITETIHANGFAD